MKTKDKTATQRNAKLRIKLAQEGFVLVQVKVPKERRNDILEVSEKMRNGAG